MTRLCQGFNALLIKNITMIDTAPKYIKAGLSVIPVRKDKKPVLPKWAQYQTRRASEAEIKKMFSGAGVFGIGIICGSISGGLEVLDFDSGGAAFPDWKKKIPPELFNKLTIEKSPHGIHVYYRSTTSGRNDKLANAKDNSVLIETRGEGGYCISSPTPGYSLIQGDLTAIQTITPAERQKLIDAAREFNQAKRAAPKKAAPKKVYNHEQKSPADWFSENGDIRAILERNGWKYDHTAPDGNEHFTRPGKDGGTGGTLKPNENGVLIFYPFSTSTEFEANQGYNAFQVLSILEFGGNDSDAARAIREELKPAPAQSFTPRGNDPAPMGAEIEVDADGGEIEPERDRETFTPFPLEALPLITRNYVIDAARVYNVDPAIIAVATLNTAGAAFGARLKLRLGGDEWEAVPFLWTAILGSSSMGKSPTMKAPLKLLRDKKRELEQKHAKEMEKFYRKNRIHQKILKKIDGYNEKAVYIAEEGDEEAADGFRQKAENLEQSKLFKPPKKPRERVLRISGAFTLEGLIGLASENPMGFQIHLDELTQLFANLSNSSDTKAAQEFLKGYDGSDSFTAYKNAEKNRKADQCLYSVLGGAIPTILQGYIKGTQYERDGLLSRFCLVWAPPIPLEQFQKKAVLTDEQKKPMKKVLEALIDFSPIFYATAEEADEEKETDPAILEMYESPQSRICRLSSEADEAFSEKRFNTYREKLSAGQDAKKSLLGKSQDLLGRIALILHVLQAAEKWIDETQKPYFPFGLETYTETREIDLDTYRRAEQITDWLVNETETVYKKLGILADDKDLIFIVDRLRKSPDGANSSTIQSWKRKWRDKGKPQLERLLSLGLKKGLWKATVKIEKNNRPCTIYKAVDK